MKSSLLISLLITLGSYVNAQAAVWQQCGGQDWTGVTTCVSGTTCTVLNSFYSQCIPSTSGGSTTISTKSTSASGGSTTSTKTTSTVAAVTTTATGSHATGTQIRAVQDPVFHLYVQNTGGVAVLGPESTSGYFSVAGSISLNSISGSKSYLNIGTTTTSYKPLTFGSTATFSGWGLEGDTIITATSSSYGRQLNFLACTSSTSGVYTLYLQTGNDVPSGTTCSLISLHLPCLC